MAGLDVPASLTAESWNGKAGGLDKSKSAAKTTLANSLKALQADVKGARWTLLDIDKLGSAKELDDRMKELEAEKKAATEKVGKQIAAVLKAVESCNGKDIDKKAADALKSIKAEAPAQKGAVEAKFSAAIAAVAQKLKTLPKAPAKTPAPTAASPTAAKKAQGMAKTYRKLGLEAIMKARMKPQMKPSRFMVVEFEKSALFYMGMKYDKAKTQEALKALCPNEKFKKTYVDPNSKVIWEKGVLTLVSNKIPPKFATKLTRSSKLILGRGMKIRMRTEAGEAVEPEGAAADEMSEADLKAELAKMAGDADVEEDEDDVSPDSVEDDGDDDQPAAAQAPAQAGTAAKSAGAAAKPAAAAAPANPALATARKQWVDTRTAAKTEIDGLFAEIGKLYGAGQEAQLDAARKTLDTCMNVLGKLDTELDALLVAKDTNERAQKMARARSTADTLINFVQSNKVMTSLDDNEVRKITAAKKITSSLAEVRRALS
ncbi:MAG TPA: hypothetical protein VHM00_05630 [Caldimonas sp.]|jgi:hypothetical protein|nr:hypothetical protein [Caldimonas sp.]HEX2540545.1 hypothetical protein [Caldimonas sp.]